MAVRIACANSAWKTGATWAVAASGSGASQTSVSASQLTTTSYVYSPAFTITNAEVLDGVMLFIERQNSTGTFSVTLSDDNGVTATREVTINVSDLPAANQATTSGQWVFFKFGSTLTADGGSDYKIGVKSSSASSVRTWRSATTNDHTRHIRTTATGAPAAADTLFVCGEHTGAGATTARTVTMNNDNTDAYNGVIVSDQGELTYDTTAASTFTLRIASTYFFEGYAAGALRMGTTATRIPVDSVAILEFAAAADNTTGWDLRYGFTFEAKGNPRTSANLTWRTRLAANLAAGSGTSLTFTDTPGWKSGDEILIGSTTRTATQSEVRTLNADTSGTGGVITAVATNAHNGTSPTQARVALLTRNVILRSTSTSFYAIGFGVRNTQNAGLNGPVFDWEWVAMRYFGDQWFRPMWLWNHISTSTLKYCLFYKSKGQGIRMDSGSNGNFTIDNCLFVDCGDDGNDVCFEISATANTTWTFTNNLAMGLTLGNAYGFSFIDMGGTFGNLEVSSLGCSSAISFGEANNSSDAGWICDGLEVGNCACGASAVRLVDRVLSYGTLKNLKIWRNAIGGFDSGAVNLSTGHIVGLTLDTGQIFGNSTYGLIVRGGVFVNRLTIRNVQFMGDSSFSQTAGIAWDSNGGWLEIVDCLIENCTFGVASGIYVAHSGYDIGAWGTFRAAYVTMTLNNCVLASTTEVQNFIFPWMLRGSYLRSQQHDQAVGSKAWTPQGLVTYETATVLGTSPGVKLTPLSTTIPLEHALGVRGRGFCVAVDSGQTVTASCKARKDGSYNGNAPKLVLKANPAIGVNADVTIDSLSVGANTTEDLTGVSPAASADGVMEFVVIADGTAGAAFCDNFDAA